MLISLHELVKKYNINLKGILHVGAHECEEINDYEQYIPRNKILWVEAIPGKVEISKNKYPNVLIENAVVSDVIESVTFNLANNGQSSSILELGLHKQFHPHVWYVDSFTAETKLLKDIICKYDIDYNFISLDIQGAELKALKGMETFLDKIDYIYTEVNSDYVYKDCVIVSELDEYLLKFGFHRVETSWWGDARWGDALYIKNLVKNKYDSLCNTPSDINEHLPTLYKYATQSESIIELGVRGCISSWAFAHGLLNNNSNSRSILLNDITECNIEEFLNVTKNLNINVEYKWINDLELDITKNVDLTFIDTWHVYGQLKRELSKFSVVTNKYIIMHDTTVDEIYGETIREGMDAISQSKQSGFSIEEINCGLWKAIEEFLNDNKDWKLCERFYNNNGLTILERINKNPIVNVIYV